VDRWLGGALVLAALLFYFVVVPAEIVIPRIQVGGGVGGGAASPLFFPRLMAVVLGFLGVLIFLRGQSRAETLLAGEGFAFGIAQAVRVAGTAAILVAYLALLDWIGYLLLTPIALASLSLLLGFRRWLLLAIVATAVPTTIYLGFRYGMKILLPEGVLD
jgi:putative tricarboxylic transport membrane protein